MAGRNSHAPEAPLYYLSPLLLPLPTPSSTPSSTPSPSHRHHRPWTDDPSLSRRRRSDYMQGDWLVFVIGWRSTDPANMCRGFKMVSVASHMGRWTSIQLYLSFVPWMDILFPCSNHITTQSYGALATRRNHFMRRTFKKLEASFEVRNTSSVPLRNRTLLIRGRRQVGINTSNLHAYLVYNPRNPQKGEEA